jgi:hypothetical protein
MESSGFSQLAIQRFIARKLPIVSVICWRAFRFHLLHKRALPTGGMPLKVIAGELHGMARACNMRRGSDR